jgi:hypothetical protein
MARKKTNDPDAWFIGSGLGDLVTVAHNHNLVLSNRVVKKLRTFDQGLDRILILNLLCPVKQHESP